MGGGNGEEVWSSSEKGVLMGRAKAERGSSACGEIHMDVHAGTPPPVSTVEIPQCTRTGGCRWNGSVNGTWASVSNAHADRYHDEAGVYCHSRPSASLLSTPQRQPHLGHSTQQMQVEKGMRLRWVVLWQPAVELTDSVARYASASPMTLPGLALDIADRSSSVSIGTLLGAHRREP